jgi:predicted membrane GTPase involved in stress response
VATRIKVLAVPGAAFVFSGNISFLDMDNGILVLVDPRDGNSYQIHFDAARVSTSESLRPGTNVTVTAIYDGARYAASAITVN